MRRVAVMNLSLRGIQHDFDPEGADTIRCDLQLGPRSDYVLTNPLFNDSEIFHKDYDPVLWHSQLSGGASWQLCLGS